MCVGPGNRQLREKRKRFGGNLLCEGNTAIFPDGTNTVGGHKQGQCTAAAGF
jgi:hypothetical protein